MPFVKYAFEVKKEESNNNDNEDNYCYLCKNMFDNDELIHFNRCKQHGICIDCNPNFCDKIDYEEVSK